jgi:hypothetical protein
MYAYTNMYMILILILILSLYLCVLCVCVCVCVYVCVYGKRHLKEGCLAEPTMADQMANASTNSAWTSAGKGVSRMPRTRTKWSSARACAARRSGSTA